jgi:uncharacterized protein YgfB (UPF0149 family)
MFFENFKNELYQKRLVFSEAEISELKAQIAEVQGDLKQEKKKNNEQEQYFQVSEYIYVCMYVWMDGWID